MVQFVAWLFYQKEITIQPHLLTHFPLWCAVDFLFKLPSHLFLRCLEAFSEPGLASFDLFYLCLDLQDPFLELWNLEICGVVSFSLNRDTPMDMYLFLFCKNLAIESRVSHSYW